VPQQWQVAPTLQAARWKIARPDRAAPGPVERQAAELLDVQKEHQGE
jgi:hypothetical protein